MFSDAVAHDSWTGAQRLSARSDTRLSCQLLHDGENGIYGRHGGENGEEVMPVTA